MPRFASVDELRTLLLELDCDYGEYAQPLWGKGVRSTEQLATAPDTAYAHAGVASFHVGHIRQAAGEQVACWINDCMLDQFLLESFRSVHLKMRSDVFLYMSQASLACG
jgi:hypothetical protein